MRKILVAVFMVLSFAGFGSAQVPTSGNVFVGYSYYNSKLLVDRANLNGWEGSVEGKVFSHDPQCLHAAVTIVCLVP